MLLRAFGACFRLTTATTPVRRFTQDLAAEFSYFKMSTSTTSNGAVYGANSSQTDFMEKEYVILVDRNDRVIGKDSKYNTHRWANIDDQNRPTLHRAFSLFIFNAKNELFLTQRSGDKLTFPDLWTNSVCSHPLFMKDELADGTEFPGLTEVGSSPAGKATPSPHSDEYVVKDVIGARRAAVRKMQHELGIPTSELPSLDKVRYLTRMHYTAPAEGKEWGEDEMDYILFLRHELPINNVNREETQAERWVTLPQLQEMMRDPKLKWSPWFAKIVANFLPNWWANVDRILAGDTSFTELKTIHHL